MLMKTNKSTAVEKFQALITKAIGIEIEIEIGPQTMVIYAPTLDAVNKAAAAVLPNLRLVDPGARLDYTGTFADEDVATQAHGLIVVDWAAVERRAPATIAALRSAK